MPLDESDAKKFQELFEKETGEKIFLEEALDCAESLVDMVKLTYKSINKKEYECTSQDSGI